MGKVSKAYYHDLPAIVRRAELLGVEEALLDDEVLLGKEDEVLAALSEVVSTLEVSKLIVLLAAALVAAALEVVLPKCTDEVDRMDVRPPVPSLIDVVVI